MFDTHIFVIQIIITIIIIVGSIMVLNRSKYYDSMVVKIYIEIEMKKTT